MPYVANCEPRLRLLVMNAKGLPWEHGMLPPDCYARVSCFLENKPTSLEERAKHGKESPISSLANLFGGSRNRKSPMNESPSHKAGESTEAESDHGENFAAVVIQRMKDEKKGSMKAVRRSSLVEAALGRRTSQAQSNLLANRHPWDGSMGRSRFHGASAGRKDWQSRLIKESLLPVWEEDEDWVELMMNREVLQGSTNSIEYLEISILQRTEGHKDHLCGTKKIECREVFKTLCRKAPGNMVMHFAVSSAGDDGCKESTKPHFTAIQVKFDFLGEWGHVTEIDDSIWDEEVQNYRVEQAKKASRSVAQQAEAKARSAELSEARVMQQAKLDTGDLEDQADEDKQGMWVP